MNVAPEPTHSSLAQRIAKVHHCILVEESTGVSPADKDLFGSLCQTSGQQNVVPCYLLDELRESIPPSSVSHFTQGTPQPSWPISALSRNISPWQLYGGFLVTNLVDGEGDDFSDWNKAY